MPLRRPPSWRRPRPPLSRGEASGPQSLTLSLRRKRRVRPWSRFLPASPSPAISSGMQGSVNRASTATGPVPRWTDTRGTAWLFQACRQRRSGVRRPACLSRRSSALGSFRVTCQRPRSVPPRLLPTPPEAPLHNGPNRG